jgi:hypothetical protein
MRFSNDPAIVSCSEIPQLSNVLEEDCSLLVDLRYVAAVAGRSLTGNTEPLEEEEEEEEEGEEKE